jgi:hypothetical protein
LKVFFQTKTGQKVVEVYTRMAPPPVTNDVEVQDDAEVQNEYEIVGGYIVGMAPSAEDIRCEWCYTTENILPEHLLNDIYVCYNCSNLCSCGKQVYTREFPNNERSWGCEDCGRLDAPHKKATTRLW